MKLELNKKNGDIIVDSLKVTAAFSVADIEKAKDSYDVIFVWESGKTLCYRIPNLNGGEHALLLTFYNKKLHHLNIGAGSAYDFPPFEITEEKKTLVKAIIQTIGGERDYSWGKVLFNVDYKGGNVTATIEYKNNS
jgi:hypothetical protein